MRLRGTIAMCCVVVVSTTPALAQRWEAGASVGYVAVGAAQFRTSLPRAGQPGVDAFEGRQEGGLEVRGSAGYWLSNGLGLRLDGGAWQTRRTVTSDQPSTASASARLVRASLQVGVRRQLSWVTVSASVGPSVVRFSGSAYESGAFGLADRSVLGAVAAVRASIELSEALALEVSGEDMMYRVTLGEIAPPPNQPPITTPLQHDLRFGVGIVFRP